MSGLRGLFGNFGGMLASLGCKSLPDFNALETASGLILVAKDGSLGTVVRVDGISRLMGAPELDALVERTSSKFSAYLGRPGHAIQVYFCRNPDHSGEVVRRLVQEQRRVAERLALDIGDVLDEKERFLPRFIVDESFYIVLWTRASLLNRTERQQMKEETATPEWWPKALDIQDVFKQSGNLSTAHTAFVQSFLIDLRENGIRAQALDGHDAIAAVRESIYPDLRGSRWRPMLPGDEWLDSANKARAPWRRHTQKPGDLSSLLWPRLDDQIFADGAEIVNSKVVRIGNNHFVGVDLTLGQQQLTAFAALLQRMRAAAEFPWRVSFLIEGDGLSRFGITETLASIAAITARSNKQIAAAIRSVRDADSQGSTAVRMRISFSTWAPVSAGLKVIEDRSTALQKAVEAWGNTQTAPTAGDPLSGALSSVLGLNIRSTAPAGVLPLQHSLAQLPWMRDASPFPSGSVVFRTQDGRPWVFDPGSSLRDAFIDIVYAVPGKGKSVLLNTTNLAFCLSAMAATGSGKAQLPMVRIIDIGPSSSGFISLLREALPVQRRHEAVHIMLRMVKEHAINPLDLPLGNRRPTSQDINFARNFLTALGTPEGHDTPPFLSDLVGAMLEELYKNFSDRDKMGKPKRFIRGVDPQIDEAMARLGIAPPEHWWAVVDALFAAGDTRLAAIAQRYAMPLIEDLMSLESRAVTDLFGKASMPGSTQSLMEGLRMMVSTAVRDYPILANPTRFDLGDARVVALDLDAVAPNNASAAGDKRCGLMYMLARFVLTKEFYHTKEMLSEFEPDYRAFHAERIRRIRETPKRVVMDEFHRTKSAASMRLQIKQDMREGRKWDVQIALASQLVGDFDDEMLDMASGIWLLGANTPKASEEARTRFGLSDTAVRVFKDLSGPGPGGAPFLVILKLKGGASSLHEHMLMNTLGPQEAWAFSTTPSDVAIRNRLYQALGPNEARRRLGRRFPSGQAKAEVERRMNDRVDRGELSDDSMNSVIDEIAAELIGAG